MTNLPISTEEIEELKEASRRLIAARRKEGRYERAGDVLGTQGGSDAQE